MKKLLFLLLVFAGTLQYGCFNRCDVDCVNPPQPLWFKVVDKVNNNNLLSSGVYVKDSIKIFYFEESVKKFVSIQFVGPVGENDIIQANIGIYQPLGQLNTYYLYLNQFDTDTILVRYVKQSDGCCTSYPLDSIAINGKYVNVDNVDYSFLIQK